MCPSHQPLLVLGDKAERVRKTLGRPRLKAIKLAGCRAGSLMAYNYLSRCHQDGQIKTQENVPNRLPQTFG
jgi:hypothetical protein